MCLFYNDIIRCHSKAILKIRSLTNSVFVFALTVHRRGLGVSIKKYFKVIATKKMFQPLLIPSARVLTHCVPMVAFWNFGSGKSLSMLFQAIVWTNMTHWPLEYIIVKFVVYVNDFHIELHWKIFRYDMHLSKTTFCKLSNPTPPRDALTGLRHDQMMMVADD